MLWSNLLNFDKIIIFEDEYQSIKIYYKEHKLDPTDIRNSLVKVVINNKAEKSLLAKLCVLLMANSLILKRAPIVVTPMFLWIVGEQELHEEVKVVIIVGAISMIFCKAAELIFKMKVIVICAGINECIYQKEGYKQY